MTRRYSQILDMLVLIDRNHRLHYLADLSGDTFSKKEYANLLRNCWSNTEFPHRMRNGTLIRMFEQAERKYLMTPAERRALDDMPEEITIFRGLQDDRARRKALSWTTSYQVALWFATRLQKPGKILQATIDKPHVYMYSRAGNEEEVVVNPNRLRKIREVREEVRR